MNNYYANLLKVLPEGNSYIVSYNPVVDCIEGDGCAYDKSKLVEDNIYWSRVKNLKRKYHDHKCKEYSSCNRVCNNLKDLSHRKDAVLISILFVE